MTLTKHHIEVTIPSSAYENKNTRYTFSNWKEACFFIESIKPLWANCKEVEDK